MIRINLLNDAAHRQRSRPVVNATALMTVGAVLGLGVCGLLIAWAVPRLLPARGPARQEAKVADIPAPPIVNARIVEEVVRDVSLERDKLRQNGEIDLPYEQLSLPEKINFQWLFARNACEFLARVVPERIGLHSVEIVNYRTVYGVGLGSSRDEVSALFNALNSEKVNVLPKPISFIRDNESGGFRFGFGCEARWPLQLTDPFVDLSLSRLPLRDQLESTVDGFTHRARDARIAVRAPLARLGAEKTGAYRRFSYRFTGVSTFVDFVDFLRRLYDARTPCAFQSLKIVAEPGAKIRIDAVVTFTTKE